MKVPPPPAKAKGLLTEAMTADQAGFSSGSEKTAAELGQIASISNQLKNGRKDGDSVCQVASPVDAVLVCGFHG
jgi:hypothetical protein